MKITEKFNIIYNLNGGYKIGRSLENVTPFM